MKKLLLTLLLLAVIGCSAEDWKNWERMTSPDGLTGAEREAAHKAKWQRAEDCKAMLTDGRVYIGMTDYQFAALWGIPSEHQIDRSAHLGGVTEWWTYDSACRPTWSDKFPTYYFCFDNGILTYWSEN